MAAPARAGRLRARSNPTGIRCGWLSRRDAAKTASWWTPRRIRFRIEQTVAMAKDFELLVLFTSSPDFTWTCKIARNDEGREPQDEGGLRRAAGHHRAGKTLRASKAIDFVVRREFDHQIAEYAKGTPLPRLPGVSYLQRRRRRAQSGRRRDREPGRTAVGDEGLQARSGIHPLQRSVSAEPVHLVLHHARLSGHVHVLPVAADALRASLALAIVR